MNNQEKNKLAQRIRELRKHKNLTQKQLAQSTGISYSSIIDYENSKSEPNAKNMAALENFFNVSGAFLRGETDKIRTNAEEEQVQSLIQKSQDELSDFLKRIEKAIKNISDDETTYTDGVLSEFLHTLNMKNTENRPAALFLFHLSAYISNTFFSVYDSVYNENLSKEERIIKASHIATEYFNGSLERIRQILLKKD